MQLEGMEEVVGWAGLLTNSKNEILTWCQEPLKQGGRVSGQNLQHFTLILTSDAKTFLTNEHTASEQMRNV